MGQGYGIQLEQVVEAAESIKSEGGRVSARTVRERLGTGSLGTIARHLQSWRGATQSKPVTELSLPADVAEAILGYLDRSVAGATASLTSELAALQRDLQDLAAENDKLQTSLQDAQHALAASEQDHATDQGRIAQLEESMATMRDELLRERQASENSRTEMAKALLRLEGLPRLEQEIVDLRHGLDEEQRLRVASVQQAAVLEAQKADLQARVTDQLRSLAEHATQIREIRERSEKLAAELADSRVEVQRGNTVAALLERDLAQCRHDLDVTRALHDATSPS